MPRTPPPPAALKHHTFATGMTIQYRPLSSWTRIQLGQRAGRSLRAAQPQPPTIATDYGGAPNPHDPAYLAALAQHQQRIGIRLFQWAAAMALDVDPATVAADLAAHAAEAERLAAFLDTLPADDADPEPSELDRFLDGASDAVRWLLLIAAGGDTLEAVQWMPALYGGGVDVEAVASATEMFSRDVPRDGSVEADPAALGITDPHARADLDTRGVGGE